MKMKKNEEKEFEMMVNIFQEYKSYREKKRKDYLTNRISYDKYMILIDNKITELNNRVKYEC